VSNTTLLDGLAMVCFNSMTCMQQSVRASRVVDVRMCVDEYLNRTSIACNDDRTNHIVSNPEHNKSSLSHSLSPLSLHTHVCAAWCFKH
jgi:hypothetical protein